MNRKLLLTACTIFAFICTVQSQVAPPCSTPPPPGAESCQNTCVYCNFDGYMGINNGFPSGGNTVCGAISIHNDQWFGFVAGTTDISIDILTSNCINGDGLQAAFFANCQDDALVCNPGVGGGGGMPLSLSWSGFVPGQTYYLMIDGWIGDVCNYEIDVTNGSVSPPSPGAPDPPSGPTQVCPGATVEYTIPEVFGAGYYQWITPAGSSINGGGNNVTLPAPSGTTVTVTFGSAGGQVCVRVGNACSAPQQACINVVNMPVPPTVLEDVVVCFEDLPYVWTEEPFTAISNPGTYNLTSTPYPNYLGCDSLVRQRITIKNQISTNIGFQYICDGECFTIAGNQYCQTGGPFQEVLPSYQDCDSVVRFSVVRIPSLAVIEQPIAPLDCANPTEILSSNGSTTGPNVSYIWTNANGNPIGNMSTQTINNGGTYNLIVTNSGGNRVCRDTATVTVTANLTPPGVTATGGVIGCLASNQTVTLTATSQTNGVNYLWTGPGITPANQNQQNPVVDTAGTYIVLVTNPVNSCTSTDTVQVVSDNTPPLAMAAGGVITCDAPVLTIDGSTNVGNASFNWSGPGINPANQNLEDPPVSVSGNYFVTVTNNLNGCTSTTTATVTENTSLPSAEAGPNQTITCAQSTVTLQGTGDAGGASMTFGWSGPGINPGNQNLLTPSVDQTGLYFLTVTNVVNGCATIDSVTVDDSLLPPTAVAGADSILNCVVDSVPLNGASSSQGPNFTVLWQGPGINPGNQNLYVPVVDQDGVYAILVTNTQNGCTATDTVVVDLDVDLPTADAGADQTLTCGTPGVTLQGGGTPANVVYLWSGPGIGANNQTQQNPSVTLAGSYQLVVTNPVNGCTAEDQAEVFQDANVPNANAGADRVLNCTVTSVDINGAGSSAGPDIQYLWTGPGINTPNDTLQSPVGISLPGTYNLLVTNTSNGCTNTDIVVISIDTLAPAASAGTDRILNCYNGSSVNLSASGSSQGPNFSLNWSGPDISPANQNLPMPAVTLPGTYDLLVTNNANTCTATDQVVVTLDVDQPTADAGSDNIIDCVVTSTTLGGNSSTGTEFVYAWTGPAIDTLNEELPNPQVDLPGNYVLVVTDTINGCTATDDVDITLNAVYPVSDAGTDQLITCLQPVVTLDGSGSSGGVNMLYQWQGPGINPGNQSLPSPDVNLPGLYILSVTDQTNACQTIDSVLVDEDTAVPTASAGPDQRLDCQITSLILDGSISDTGAVIQYLWTGPGISPANQNLQNPSVNQPGAYTLVVTNNFNGCSASDDVLIDQNITPPVASAGADLVLTCALSSQPLDGSASSTGAEFEYLWQGPGINTNNFDDIQPVVSDSGTYVLIVTNVDNQCTSTDQVYVGLDGDFPLTEAGSPPTLTCVNDTVQLDGSMSLAGPGINYSWSGPALVPGTENSITPLVTSPGVYTLTVLNTNNGCSDTDVVTVDEDILSPIAEAGTNQTLTCATINGVTLDASGSDLGAGFTLLWTGPDINPGNETLVNPVVGQTGPYTVLITNLQNGCTATDNVQVNEDFAPPTAIAGPDRILNCNIQQVTLDGTGSSLGGSFEILWSGPGIDPISQTDLTPVVLVDGTYTILVTNLQNGCTATDTVQVSLDNASPDLSVATDTITCAEPEGQLSAASSVNGVTFLWTGPGANTGNNTQPAILVSEPGSYTVVITAPNGCTSSETVIMDIDDDFPDGAAEGTELNCKNNGAAIISGDVDTPGATFFWTGPANFNSTDQFPTVTMGGTYVFNIVASNGCKRTIEVDVTEDFVKPTVQAFVPNLLDCNTPSVNISGAGTSTGPSFTYQWNTNNGNIVSGSNTLNPLVDAPGAYTLVVANSENGCIDSTTVSVQNDPAVPTSFVLDVNDIPCFGGDDGSIFIRNIIGGTPPILYSFNGSAPSATNQFIDLPAGQYSIRLQDVNGCILDTLVSIVEPAELLVNIGDDEEILLGEEVSVEAIIVNETPLQSIVWSPEAPCDSSGATCLQYTWQPPNSYYQRITVTDENGCVAEDRILIQVRKDRYIYVPNVFNPESDNPINTFLMIFGNISIDRVKSWSIYDRWGEQVFHAEDFPTDDPAYSWDGRFNGKELSPGVFVWVAEVVFIDGEVVTFKGDVAIMR